MVFFVKNSRGGGWDPGESGNQSGVGGMRQCGRDGEEASRRSPEMVATTCQVATGSRGIGDEEEKRFVVG
jgi:hypothetical protein